MSKTITQVRAKFLVSEIQHTTGGYRKVKMTAVMDGDGENGDFNKYTPSGSFEMLISPETRAVDFFEVDKQYYLDFTEAPKE